MTTGTDPVETRQFKFVPQAKLPTTTTLQAFTVEERDRLARRLAEPVDCVFDPIFDSADADRSILGDMTTSRFHVARRGNPNDDSGVDLFALPTRTALKGDDERVLFQRLNLVRYRMVQMLTASAGKRLSAEDARRLIELERTADDLRADIVRSNMPLVLAMAKRTRITGVDISDLISEGNLALLRAVDKFDCNRGFKFSTYACRAILKSFSRVATRTSRMRNTIAAEFDPGMEKSDFQDRQRTDAEKSCLEDLKAILGQNLAKLSAVEEAVIRARFNVTLTPPATRDELDKGKTLEQVGEMIGVTKERVRQIQNKALTKLRSALQQHMPAS